MERVMTLQKQNGDNFYIKGGEKWNSFIDEAYDFFGKISHVKLLTKSGKLLY